MLRVSVIVLVLVVHSLGSPSFNRAEMKSIIEEQKTIPVFIQPSVNSIAVNTTPEPLEVVQTEEPVDILDWLQSNINTNSSEILENRIGLDDYLFRTPNLD